MNDIKIRYVGQDTEEPGWLATISDDKLAEIRKQLADENEVIEIGSEHGITQLIPVRAVACVSTYRA